MVIRNFYIINVQPQCVMKQYIQIECPVCQSDDLVKNGKSENGTQRYRCKTCRKSFQWEYRYRAWLPDVKEQIVTQTINSSGIRDISRNLGSAKNIVIAELKKSPLRESSRLRGRAETA